MRVALNHPHQLYPDHPAIRGADACVLIEEPLLFTQYRFHAKKLILHRATKQASAVKLRAAGMHVRYVDSCELTATADVANVPCELNRTEGVVVDVCDDWLDGHLRAALRDARDSAHGSRR